MTPSAENIRFNVLRNALYHTARRLVFERRSRWINFLIIVSGASAISGVLGWLEWPQFLAGVIAALLGAIQLVFDPAGAARLHQTMQRDYYHLLADLEAVIQRDEEQCALWYSRMVRIAGDEPPVMRAVDSKAYNDAIGALEWPDDQRLHIPWWQRPVQHIISFEGYPYKKLCEIKGAQKGRGVAAAS